jgi:hypothetical protein
MKTGYSGENIAFFGKILFILGKGKRLYLAVKYKGKNH